MHISCERGSVRIGRALFFEAKKDIVQLMNLKRNRNISLRLREEVKTHLFINPLMDTILSHHFDIMHSNKDHILILF